MENFRIDPKLRTFVRKYEYPLWWAAWFISAGLTYLTIHSLSPAGSQAAAIVAIISGIVWSFAVCAWIPFITGSSKLTGLQLIFAPTVPFLINLPFLKVQTPDWQILTPVLIGIYLCGAMSYLCVRIGKLEFEMMDKLDEKLRTIKGNDLPVNSFDLDRSQRERKLLAQSETLSIVDGTGNVLRTFSEQKDKLMKAWILYILVPGIAVSIPMLVMVFVRK